MRSKRLWRQLAVSVIAAVPVGGFMLGLVNAGDPDPNPIGRIMYAFMMAVVTPLHAGFPPHDQAGPGQFFNAWPHIGIAFLLLMGWFVYRDRKASRRADEPSS